MLPIISMSALQRSPRTALAAVVDFAVIQSHGTDRAFVLHPALGRILLESGMLEALRKKSLEAPSVERELRGLIGNVLRELSKK